MTTATKSQYELFQEWLNDCPVTVLDYQDFTDQFQITFVYKYYEDELSMNICYTYIFYFHTSL